MAFPAPEFKEPISTPPKLSLFSLPTKLTTLPDGPTPPPNTVATIPFLWEEAPGKPRPTGDPPKSKTVRSLDLPPRLTTTTIIPSPTTVLGGPYNEGVYTSKSILCSPENKVVAVSSNTGKSSRGKITNMPLRNLMRKDRSPVSSWRWDSFSDGGDRSPAPAAKFCSWRWDKGGGRGSVISSSFDHDLQKSLDSNSKIAKAKRKNSFRFINGAASGFLADMYVTFKQAMQWRSRR